MLADPAHVLAEDFEALITADGLAERGAFIVDPDGKIQVYEVTVGGIGRNAKELLRLVQAAKFVREHGDRVCLPSGSPAPRPSSRPLTSWASCRARAHEQDKQQA